MTPKAKPQPEQKKEAVSKTTTTAPAPALVTANKQTATFDRLKEAWIGRGADLSKMTTTMDGKFMLVTVGEQWPVIRIGASGGIELPAIKSYPKAFDAAIIGDQLLAKQVAREQKKTAATAAPAEQPTADAQKATPATKKAKQHAELERQMA